MQRVRNEEKKNIKSIFKKKTNTNNRKEKVYIFFHFLLFCREKDKNTSEMIIRKRRVNKQLN
jgi:hypothetical protein